MKRVFFTSMIFLFAMTGFAQVASDTVRFNNYVSSTNNDLSQKCTQSSYINGTVFSQSVSNGITGGAIVIPDSVSWANEIISYNYKYKNGLGKTTKTSICFKYNSALYKSDKYERPAAIFLTPSADGNHYFNATLTPYGGYFYLGYVTYFNSVSTMVQASTMKTGNWYKLSLSTNVTATNEIAGEIDLYDLGATGLATPTLVASATGTTTDEFFANDASIQVAFCGAHWGGAEYLDNFTFQGVKAVSNTTSVNDANNAPVGIYPNPATDHIVVAGNAAGEASTYSVLNAQGELVKTGKLSGTTTINVSDLSAGLYNFKVQNKTSKFIKK